MSGVEPSFFVYDDAPAPGIVHEYVGAATWLARTDPPAYLRVIRHRPVGAGRWAYVVEAATDDAVGRGLAYDDLGDAYRAADRFLLAQLAELALSRWPE